MSRPIRFEVLGIPAPQGSKRAFVANGKARMRDMGGTKAVAWRDSVAAAARDVAGHADINAPLDGVLVLDVQFRFPMPASRPKKIRALGEWPKTTTPDLDKLLRSIGDGLQAGGLIADDARFWSTSATKLEVVGWTGAVISIGQAGDR